MATVQNSDRRLPDQPQPQAQVIVQQARSTAVREPEIRVYAHSRMLYWWPVWACGYVMALLTHLYGHPYQIGRAQELFHDSSNLGVIFVLTLAMVILITNFTVRGLSSVIVILSLAIVALLLAYYHKWDAVLEWLGNLKIHLNLGAYFWFSTVIFGMWALTVLILDHLSYWR